MRPRLDPAQWRAAWWAWRSLRLVRKDMTTRRWLDVELAPPVHLPLRAERGVRAVLRRYRYGDTCLARSIVRQAFLAAHGIERDVVVGVRGGEEWGAHAWLDGDGESEIRGFAELARRPSSACHPSA